MVTPLLVHSNPSVVDYQLNQLRDSGYYNSVCSLIDLQSGRNYIFPGRTRERIDSRCRANIEKAINKGVMPILIIRNDWSARTGTGTIPSIGNINIQDFGGKVAFYDFSLLYDQFSFFDDIKDLWPHIHVQLNIEPSPVESARFAAYLTQYLRFVGFRNLILLNPAFEAINAHFELKSDWFDPYDATFARSKGSGYTTPDPIFNSDGNTSINNMSTTEFRQFMANVQAQNKPYIIWCGDFANAEQLIPSKYL